MLSDIKASKSKKMGPEMTNRPPKKKSGNLNEYTTHNFYFTLKGKKGFNSEKRIYFHFSFMQITL